MKDPIPKAYVLAVIIFLFVLILVLDFYILPEHLLVSSLYVVPILIAALSLSPRAVLAISLISLVLDLVTAWLKSPSITIWPYGTLALVIVGCLGYLLSRELREEARRTAEAEEARERLQEFMGMVAHDLRGPLTSLLGYSQILSKGGSEMLPEARGKAILAIGAEARRMNRLIGDLLDAARIGAGAFVVEGEKMDLVRLARRVVDELQATTSKHHIQLVAPKSIEGFWDTDRLVQLLENLVANAIKYSPKGGEVRVQIDQAGSSAVVRVSDQGVGIAAEDMPFLFEPFSRPYREQPIKGAGLGLYISKAIVEAHGGQIRAESQGRGKGTTFVFTLPLSSTNVEGNHFRRGDGESQAA